MEVCRRGQFILVFKGHFVRSGALESRVASLPGFLLIFSQNEFHNESKIFNLSLYLSKSKPRVS
jgi:hypothetical protein